MDSVKSLIREQLEKNKIFEQMKLALTKDPRLASLDKNQLLEKIKSEGILDQILKTMPLPQKVNGPAAGTPVDVQAQR